MSGTSFKEIAMFIKSKGGDVSLFPKFAEAVPDLVKMAAKPPPDFDEMIDLYANLLNNVKDPTDERVTKAVGYTVASKYIPQLLNNKDDSKNFKSELAASNADLIKYINESHSK